MFSSHFTIISLLVMRKGFQFSVVLRSQDKLMVGPSFPDPIVEVEIVSFFLFPFSCFSVKVEFVDNIHLSLQSML